MGAGLVLIAVYVLCVSVGNLIAWRIGLVVEQHWPVLSLPVFLSMFFGVLILAWPLSLRLTRRWADKEAAETLADQPAE